MLRLGVDLGGTKTELAALDVHGNVLLRRRDPTRSESVEAICRTIVGLVRDAESFLQATGSVGVATPGSLCAGTGLMRGSNTTVLNGVPFAEVLSHALGREVRIANDANCFALSEACDGAAAGCETVFGVILGTGVGGGIVREGRVHAGAHGSAGEWGHSPLPWPGAQESPGPLCYCGARGCIETFLCGAGLVRDAGEGHSAPEIVSMANAGNAVARAALERYEDRLARGLATVVNLLDPDAVVLGGGLANMDALYANVPGKMARYTFTKQPRTRLLRARHGDSSGVRGAAWLWPLPDLRTGV